MDSLELCSVCCILGSSQHEIGFEKSIILQCLLVSSCSGLISQVGLPRMELGGRGGVMWHQCQEEGEARLDIKM